MEQYTVRGKLADGCATPFLAKVNANCEADAIHKAETEINDSHYYILNVTAISFSDEIKELKAKAQYSFFVSLVAICLLIAIVGTYLISLF
nr:MAG TPA: hypothetical protein [Caudoviricetes sp.]